MLGMYYSFTEWNGVANEAKWVGLDNFSHILWNDDKFGTAFWFTVRFTVVGVVAANIFGFLLAYFLTKPLKTKNVLRTIFLCLM